MTFFSGEEVLQKENRTKDADHQIEAGMGGDEGHHRLQFQERCPHWGGGGKGKPAKQL